MVCLIALRVSRVTSFSITSDTPNAYQTNHDRYFFSYTYKNLVKLTKSYLHQSVSKTLLHGEGQQTVPPSVLLHGRVPDRVPFMKHVRMKFVLD